MTACSGSCTGAAGTVVRPAPSRAPRRRVEDVPTRRVGRDRRSRRVRAEPRAAVASWVELVRPVRVERSAVLVAGRARRSPARRRCPSRVVAEAGDDAGGLRRPADVAPAVLVEAVAPDLGAVDGGHRDPSWAAVGRSRVEVQVLLDEVAGHRDVARRRRSPRRAPPRSPTGRSATRCGRSRPRRRARRSACSGARPARAAVRCTRRRRRRTLGRRPRAGRRTRRAPGASPGPRPTARRRARRAWAASAISRRHRSASSCSVGSRVSRAASVACASARPFSSVRRCDTCTMRSRSARAASVSSSPSGPVTSAPRAACVTSFCSRSRRRGDALGRRRVGAGEVLAAHQPGTQAAEPLGLVGAVRVEREPGADLGDHRVAQRDGLDERHERRAETRVEPPPDQP